MGNQVARTEIYTTTADQPCCFRSMELRGAFDWLSSNTNSLSPGSRTAPLNALRLTEPKLPLHAQKHQSLILICNNSTLAAFH